MMSGVRRQFGMTLLEVLVATAILAVISSMAFMSLNNLSRSKQTLDQVQRSLNQESLAFFQFQHDIQMAVSQRQLLGNKPNSDFIADGRSITLLKFKATIAPIQRTTTSRMDRIDANPLIRVRWYLRGKTWYRATQNAAMPLSSNRWQERPMIDLNRFNCVYQNVSGQMQSSWPMEPRQSGQLPEVVNCEVENDQGQLSELKVVPWQRIGFI